MRNHTLARMNRDRALARRQAQEPPRPRPHCWGCGGIIGLDEPAVYFYDGPRRPAKGYHQECHPDYQPAAPEETNES